MPAACARSKSSLPRAGVVATGSRNPRPVRRALRALESLLAGPPPPGGTLAQLVAWEANRVLEDASDAGARACMLFTDEANPTSNNIYGQIGYRRVASASEYLPSDVRTPP